MSGDVEIVDSRPWHSSVDDDQVIPALSSALGEMTDVAKTQTANAGTYAYAYASLDQVHEHTRAVLAGHGLAVTQSVTTTAAGVRIATTIVHASAQWIAFPALEVPCQNRDAQSIGSATTYGRRYALLAVCGLATEDDDGARATRAAQPAGQPRPSPDETAGRDAFARLRSYASDDTARTLLREEAELAGRGLTERDLVTYPEWRAKVLDLLDQIDDLPSVDEPITDTGADEPPVHVPDTATPAVVEDRTEPGAVTVVDLATSTPATAARIRKKLAAKHRAAVDDQADVHRRRVADEDVSPDGDSREPT